ncbi:MAG: HesA/MoeB/ThiF family protein [Bacteroidales bacterium]|nr:HesA/MoeB/ThiF family protein [Bacteroidales bacterium]
MSQNDLTRYQRQIKIKDFGNKSQIKLKHSKVTVFGCGGLGCPTATYLAASGVGIINLVDFQKPELSNLNRQIMHFESDLNTNFKSFSLKDKLLKLNSSIEINAFTEIIDDKSIDKFKDSDIFVNCLDNITTRYIINNFSIKEKIPIVHAGVNSFYGQLTSIIPDCTPCLNCIFPDNLTNSEGPPL